ncbi:hypothetical protein [Cerasicoccus arenae]|uniref:hypothetical protein n=2 Tax=Cerasicoccus arenae TaxID=424488 RepID=UPI001905A82C|nr:hypothetical protein [Cerasicoccus arenae]
MTEQEMIEALGTPVSEVGRQSKKILIYTGGSAELRTGRLYSVDGLTMAYMAPDGQSQFTFSMSSGWSLNGEPIDSKFRFTPPVENLPPPPDTGVKFYRPGEEADKEPPQGVNFAPPPVKAPPPPPPSVVEPDPQPVAAPPPVEDASNDLAEAEDVVFDEDMAEYDEWDEWEDYEEYELTPMQKAIELAISVIIQFVLTLFILKVAFENKGFPVLWKQLLPLSLSMALVALGVDFLMAAVGIDMWEVNQAINYLALSGLIVLFTDVQRATTAMTIALIARSVTYVVNWVLLLLLLNYGFGY